MSELQSNKDSMKQHAKLIPQNQSVASGSTVSSASCETRHCTTVEGPSSDFSHRLNCLRNPEARKLVEDFQKNVFDLLVTKTKWRVKSRRNQDGSAASEPESLNSEATPAAEKQETLEDEDTFCKKFASSLILKDEEENGCTPRLRAAGPVMFEVDDGGKMEFNPFKLVAIIGQKLTLAAQLMDEIRDEKMREMLAELMQDKAMQTESIPGEKLSVSFFIFWMSY